MGVREGIKPNCAVKGHSRPLLRNIGLEVQAKIGKLFFYFREIGKPMGKPLLCF